MNFYNYLCKFKLKMDFVAKPREVSGGCRWINQSTSMSIFICQTLLLCSYGLSTFSHAASHHPQDFLKSIAGSKTEGEQIVQHYCATCHAEKPLIPLGAPRIKNVDDWQARMKQGLDQLLTHTDSGFNAMPARGGCFECSDEQLRLAVLAMLPEQKKSL